MFYCPICMTQICEEEDTPNNEPQSSKFSTSSKTNRMFQLESCSHTMCIDCLSTYCVSRVNEGITNIKCCYPSRDKYGHTTTTWSGAVKACDHALPEDDIRQLLFHYQTNYNIMHTNNTKEQHNQTNVLAKYERFKFDSEHKDSARRCPTCDHPHIFELQPVKISVSAPIPEDTSLNNKENTQTRSKPHLLSLRSLRPKKKIADPDTNIPLQEPSKKDIKCIKTSKRNSNLTLKNKEHHDSTLEEAQKIETSQTENPSNDQKNAVLLEPQIPVVNCLQCQTQFCYYHSNAHPNMTCEEYIQKTQNETNLNTTYLNEFTKSCPSCKVKVQKMGGCNQMKCVNCGVNFCWICLAIVDDGTFPNHFQWWNVNGCPNMQLHESVNPSRFTLFLSRFLSFLQLLFVGIPSICLTMISYILCFFFVPRSNEHETEMQRATHCISFWGNCLTFTVAIPIAIFGGFISALVWMGRNFLCICKRTIFWIRTTVTERLKSYTCYPNDQNGKNVDAKGEPSLDQDKPSTASQNAESQDNVLQNMEAGLSSEEGEK